MLTEQVEPDLVGGPNIWCPVTSSYNHEDAETAAQAGEDFWWYVCTGPKAPYCTLFIDHPATEMRVWLWQTWQRNIEGILVWQTNYWTSSAAYPDRASRRIPTRSHGLGQRLQHAAQASRRKWGNGDGRFIYPPEAAADGTSRQPGARAARRQHPLGDAPRRRSRTTSTCACCASCCQQRGRD